MSTLSPDTRIAVIGGDRRMLHTARRLADAGASVTRFGQPLPGGDESVPRHAVSLSDAAEDATALVLPLPVSRDGVTVNCPFTPELSITFPEIAALMRKDPRLLLFGGKLPPLLYEALGTCPDSAILRVTDYFADEGFTLTNAALTAEGALALAARETDYALRGSTAAIIGYGRIGKLLARLLLAVGMDVTVCARRREALLWAATDGCHPVRMGDSSRAGGGMFPLCYGHPILFNTVPETVMGRDFLLRLEPDTLIIDLASPPFGASDEDVAAATAQNRLRYLRAPGIPGAYAPRDAGYAIADCIGEMLADRMRSASAPGTHTKGDAPS